MLAGTCYTRTLAADCRAGVLAGGCWTCVLAGKCKCVLAANRWSGVLAGGCWLCVLAGSWWASVLAGGCWPSVLCWTGVLAGDCWQQDGDQARLHEVATHACWLEHHVRCVASSRAVWRSIYDHNLYNQAGHEPSAHLLPKSSVRLDPGQRIRARFLQRPARAISEIYKKDGTDFAPRI